MNVTCLVSNSVVFVVSLVFFFKQKTAYEMRISDWSSDVCSSDLLRRGLVGVGTGGHRTSPVGGCHRHDDRAPPNVTWYGTARAKNFPEAVLRRDIKISLCLIRRDAIAMCRASVGRVGACPMGRGSGRERVCQDG